MHISGFSIVRRAHKVAPTKRFNPNFPELLIMKTSIALGFALSVLASTAVFASPEKSHQRAIVDASSATVINQTVAAATTNDDITAANRNGAQPFSSKSSSTVIVADNRKEFGSSYQRY
jgi:hypothetical protein